jgi:hypothetical protein
MGFYEDFLEGLDRTLEEVYNGNKSEMAKACGVDSQRIYQYYTRERVSYIEKLAQVIDGMGAKLVFPDQDDLRGKDDFVRHALTNLLQTPEFNQVFMEMVDNMVQTKVAQLYYEHDDRKRLRSKVNALPEESPEEETE